MVQTSYPGVYIQEKASGVKTITGVATSIAAFFGRSAKGPLNRAVRCLSFADYVRGFGSPHPDSDLAASVQQFFNNGGTDCYVVRLAHGATRSDVDLEDWNGVAVLSATAKMEGAWGDGVRLEVDYNTPNPGETFNLRVIYEEAGQAVATELHRNLTMDPASPRFAPAFVRQGSQLIDVTLVLPEATLNALGSSFAGYSEARRPLGANLVDVQGTLGPLINFGNPAGQRRFDISVNGSAYVPVDLTTWDVTDASVAALGDLETQLADRINQALGALVPAPTVTVSFAATGGAGTPILLRITAANGEQTAVRVRRGAASDLSAALLLGADNGGVELARRSNFRPAPTGTVLRIEDGAGHLGSLNAFLELEQQHLQSITVDSEVIALNAAPNNIQTTAAADPFSTDGLPDPSASAHHDGVREKLRIIAQAVSNNANVSYRAEVHGYQLVILAKSGTINQQPTVTLQFQGAAPPAAVAAITAAITPNTRQYTLGTIGLSTFSSNGHAGLDGTAPEFGDYVGNPVDKTGFYALETVDLFNLMILPADHDVDEGTRQQIWGPASIYCQSRRAFLLIDAPNAWSTADGRPAIVQNLTQVNDLRATVVKDYSGVFYPNIRFNDRGLPRTIGPTGAIAGLLARTDASRGVWKAPAGTEADLRAILGLEVKLTDMENGVLNKLGVNCLRSFPTGHVNWGARTLDGSDDIGSEWKYIPIRRLALFLEESLYRGTQWVVFEPNDEPLWAKIRLNVGVFMHQLFRQGAFQGSTPDQAYYVKCDAETTTQADRNLGIVNIEVGFAPLKPAEFVIITIQQIAGDLL